MTETDYPEPLCLQDMHAVCRMFDDDGQLLYVGVIGNIHGRLCSHSERRWFPLVTTIKLEWCATQAGATAAQQRAIRDEHPRIEAAGKRDQPEGAMTIRAALAEGLFGPVNADSIRKRISRAGGLQHVGWDGTAKLYDRIDLMGLMRW